MKFVDRLLGRTSPGDFADRLVRSLRQAGDRSTLRYDPAEDAIIRTEGDKVISTLNLGNLYRTYRELPRARRAEHIRQCTRVALSHLRTLPEDFDAARPDLRPRLWTRLVLEQQRLRSRLGAPGAGAIDLPSTPVGEHLLAALAYDWPESVQSISPSDLERWGVTLYEAMEAALANLAEATEGYARIGDGLYLFASGDTYDATRLLLVDRLEDIEVVGRPLALVPNRDVLLLAGEDDHAALEQLAALGENGLGENYPLSGIPLVLEDGAWTDWRPPGGHPLVDRFAGLAARWLGPAYATQKELLDAIHQKEGSDLFVASFSGAEREGGGVVTYSVWAEGVYTLLPVTEKVVLVQPGREGFAALGEWDRVAEVVGELLEPTDHYPARYRVREFPDRAKLDAIGQGAL